MSKHEKFGFKSLDELEQKIVSLGLSIRLDADFSPLQSPARVGGLTAPNAIASLPMEGCDSEPDGAPSGLVERRYLRLASGGAGLIWWEACAVGHEGRANELQMMLTRENVGRFADLLKRVNEQAAAKNGAGFRPLHVLQLTHSGRYSRPAGHRPRPMFPQHDPVLDAHTGVKPEDEPVSDAWLDGLIEKYVESARLAREAGFDGVDIKACHRYLINELLASHTRPGRYGGSFENRSRFLLDTVAAVREAVPGFLIACRFNVFDAHPYPYGFGEDREDMWKFDPDEPVRLVRALCEAGVGLLSNSAGNPYYIYPQVTRPFDQSSMGIPVPDEHPLTSVHRLFSFTDTVTKAAGGVPVVGNGYTWLRAYAPYAGAANIADGRCAFMGFGRMSFAYPDAPRDILSGAGMDPAKCCLACSKCTQIMRDHGRTGCVMRDGEIYLPFYRDYRAGAAKRENA